MTGQQYNQKKRIVVLISADAEWRALRSLMPGQNYQPSPYGEWFPVSIPDDLPVIHTGRPSMAETGKRSSKYSEQFTYDVKFLHGGWGKIAAAASTQYAIDRWDPDLLVNLGTCGGFEGDIERGAIILVEKTIVYDIIEQMGDFDSHIAYYVTELDLSWLHAPFPHPVVRWLLVSGDRDLLADDIPKLKAHYNALAGDWESGAIAYVARRNQTRLLILRGVTDLVGSQGSPAYGDLPLFEDAAKDILSRLILALPDWLDCVRWVA